MTFRKPDRFQGSKFNSGDSCDFLDMYETFMHKEIEADLLEPSSRTFAPSSFRCDRKSWFRLKGSEPDRIDLDIPMQFTAMVGTACHHNIQSRLIRLSNSLEETSTSANIFKWIEVEDYLRDNPIPYKYKLKKNGFETEVEILEPFPVKFACDGIIYWKGKYFLLEIKTSELSSFSKLSSYKEYHRDQIVCYCTMLGIHDVFVVYQERQFGSMKCFTFHVNDREMRDVTDRMQYVMSCVEDNIAPTPLAVGDPFCSGCVYAKKCREWGRGAV